MELTMKKLILALGITLASTPTFAGLNFSIGASHLSHEMESHVRQERGLATQGTEYFAYDGSNKMIDFEVGYDFNENIALELVHSLSAGGDSTIRENIKLGTINKYWESHDKYNVDSLTDLRLKFSTDQYRGFRTSIITGVTAPNITMGPSLFDKTLFNAGVSLSYQFSREMTLELSYIKYIENNMSQEKPSGYQVTIPSLEEGGEDTIKKINNFEDMRWSGDKISLGLKYAF